MGNPQYRAVMDGKGGLIVEKRSPWYIRLIFWEAYMPVSNSLRDLKACDELVARLKLADAGKTNFRKVVRNYR